MAARPGVERQRVVSRLLDRVAQPLDPPLHCNARIVEAPGGVCTVEARPGDDLQKALNGLRPDGGELCLAAGVYELDKPLTMKAHQRVTISGRGPATVLRGQTPNVIHAELSAHLILRMLRIEAASGGEPGMVQRGIVNVRDCGAAKIVDCEIVGLDSPNAKLACIASQDRAGSQGTDLLVERCRLQGGQGMFGVWIDNCTRVQLVGNEITITDPRARRLALELVLAAIEAAPAMLTASFRSKATEVTESVPIGDATAPSRWSRTRASTTPGARSACRPPSRGGSTPHCGRWVRGSSRSATP